jgi:uncharacterized membrane protein
MGIERMHTASLLWLIVVGYGLLALVALSGGIYVILSLVQMLAAGW